MSAGSQGAPRAASEEKRVKGAALIVALSALLPRLAGAHGAWIDDPAAAQRLAQGQIIQRSSSEGKDARIQAAVRIDAPPQAVWATLKDCAHAPSFIPGLKRCQRLAAAPDGSWEIIEHVVKYSWLMPTIHSIFRADYHAPRRIDFRRVGGDLKSEQGTWSLEPGDAGASTLVEYDVAIDPGFWIPQTVIKHTLRKELPEVLAALRARVEQRIARGDRPVTAAQR